MCIVSYVGDTYRDRFAPWNPQEGIKTYPGLPFNPAPPQPYIDWGHKVGLPTTPIEYASKDDLELLRKEVLEMKEMMKKAIKYDEVHNEPHCEDEEKYQLLRKIAAMVGVSLDDVIGKPDKI